MFATQEPELTRSVPYRERMIELSVFKLADGEGYVTLGNAVRSWSHETEVFRRDKLVKTAFICEEKKGFQSGRVSTTDAALQAGIELGKKKTDEELS